MYVGLLHIINNIVHNLHNFHRAVIAVCQAEPLVPRIDRPLLHAHNLQAIRQAPVAVRCRVHHRRLFRQLNLVVSRYLDDLLIRQLPVPLI